VETRDLNNWQEFTKELQDIEALRDTFEKGETGYVSGLLFRGQGDATLPLGTTLERYKNETNISAESYFCSALAVKPEIETYTGKRWVVKWKRFLDWTASVDLLLSSELPGSDYLIYLRHHGFPSPLLDWTRSPFIAAFFAFDEVPREANRVAIYVYLEFAGQEKTQDGDNPVILTLPSNVTSHKRHFIQQSAYTICVAKPKSGVVFSSYEEAIAKTDSGENLLWKLTLPVSERMFVLRQMDQMNINRLSLFDNEEGLMSTVALREFYLKGNA
jgi:hypothetical protein